MITIEEYKNLVSMCESLDDEVLIEDFDTIDEGLLGSALGIDLHHMMTQLIWITIGCLAGFELVKFGVKFTISFVKGLFSRSSSEDFAREAGQKARKKLFNGVKKLFSRSNKDQLNALKEMFKDLKEEKDAKAAEEKINEITGKLREMNEEAYNELVSDMQALIKINAEKYNKIISGEQS